MKKLNKIQVACLLLCAVAGNSAYAQSTSGSNSTSGSTSGSGSTSTSGAGNGYVGSVQSGSSSNSSTSSTAGSGISQQGQSVNVTFNGASGSGGSGTNGSGVGGATQNAATNPSDPPTQRVEYSGTQTVKTNPSIAAPSLTTTLSDTCMGSVSLGVSVPGVGVTGGATLVDAACVRRLDSREFRAMGLNDVALALLCQSEENRKAVEATGHDCPGWKRDSAGNYLKDAPVQQAKAGETTDPFVRARMGLPPIQPGSQAPAVAIQPPPTVPVQQPAPQIVPPPSAQAALAPIETADVQTFPVPQVVFNDSTKK